jgi:hypothetical protein
LLETSRWVWNVWFLSREIYISGKKSYAYCKERNCCLFQCSWIIEGLVPNEHFLIHKYLQRPSRNPWNYATARSKSQLKG